MVGNAHKLELPDIGRARAGQVRLRGLRLVHTHLKSEPLTKDDLTDLALLRLDMVAAVGVGRDGPARGAALRAPACRRTATDEFWRAPRCPASTTGQPDLVDTLEALEEELDRKAAARAVGGREQAILVAVCLDGNRGQAEASLAELKELARTAGVEVIDSVLQMRREADPRYLIGRGKLEDLNLRSMQSMADLLIFDKDLTPVAGPAHRRGDQPQGARPHAAHPRHLRPARAERRGQAPGRAGAAEVPAAAAGAERRLALPARRWHRRPRPR